MTKSQKTSFFLNLLIVLMTIFAIWAMLADFRFMSDPSKPAVLSSANAKAFKYFTVDSNVFAGIISLIMRIMQVLMAKDRLKKIPKLLQLLKLADGNNTLEEIIRDCGMTSNAESVADFFLTLGQAGYLTARLEVNKIAVVQ